MIMQVFLSHSSKDKDIVEAIGHWLVKKDIDVWIDEWCLAPGDSLVEKIGESIEASDRLVVFLSPHSVESKWVRKEVASGVVMELAEEKGLGVNFVIPALLASCKVPILLRDKLYANFTNKSFESACEELLRGILGQPLGPQDRELDNRIVRTHTMKPIGQRQYALVVEFGVRLSPTEGLHVEVDVEAKYAKVIEWFGKPNDPTMRASAGGVFTGSYTRREPPIYARKFSSPGLTSTRSYYCYFEADEPLRVKETQFLDYYDQQP